MQLVWKANYSVHIVHSTAAGACLSQINTERRVLINQIWCSKFVVPTISGTCNHAISGQQHVKSDEKILHKQRLVMTTVSGFIPTGTLLLATSRRNTRGFKLQWIGFRTPHIRHSYKCRILLDWDYWLPITGTDGIYKTPTYTLDLEISLQIHWVM